MRSTPLFDQYKSAANLEARIALRRHEDGLVVTEAEPLADYALSRLSLFADETFVDDGVRQKVIERVKVEMGKLGGAIRITKDSGLFIAQR